MQSFMVLLAGVHRKFLDVTALNYLGIFLRKDHFKRKGRIRICD